MAALSHCAIVRDEDLPDIQALLHLDCDSDEKKGAFLSAATVVTNGDESVATERNSDESKASATVDGLISAMDFVETAHTAFPSFPSGATVVTNDDESKASKLKKKSKASEKVKEDISSHTSKSQNANENTDVAGSSKGAAQDDFDDGMPEELMNIASSDVMPIDICPSAQPSEIDNLVAFEPEPLSLEADNSWDDLLKQLGGVSGEVSPFQPESIRPIFSKGAYRAAEPMTQGGEPRMMSTFVASPELNLKRQHSSSAGVEPQKKKTRTVFMFSSPNESQNEKADVISGKTETKIPDLPSNSDATGHHSSSSPALPLYTPKDNERLSELLCLVRAQIEVFTASETDVEERKKLGGVACNIDVGRVGLRCINCSHLPVKERPKGAVTFPNTLKLVYQCVRNFKRNHLLRCTYVPPHVNERLALLETKRKHSRNAQAYMIESCSEFGMFQAEDGIRFRSWPPPWPAPSLSTMGTEKVGEDDYASDCDSFLDSIHELPGLEC